MSEDRFDEKRSGAFLKQVLEQSAGAMTVFMASLGDRLGLFRSLAQEGPSTSDELAQRTGIHERYAREWLLAMHSARYLERETEAEAEATIHRYRLPREHRPILAKEGHPFFQGGLLEQVSGLFPAFEAVLGAFRSGGGVPNERYGPAFSRGLDRVTGIWAERFLVPMWLGSVPEVTQALTRGVEVAEVGCGAGRVTIALARAFPESRFVGYDVDERALAMARDAAKAAGVDHRVRFDVHDIVEPLPSTYSLVACFDVLHDIPHPETALARLRDALTPEGTLLVGEWEVEEDPDEGPNPFASLMLGFSVLYCVPTTLSRGDDARGTLGLPEAEIFALADSAGFRTTRKLFTGHPILSLYALQV